MQKIDTTNWLPFKVGDLFRIKGGKGITKFEISTHEGSLPAIQSGEANFGCIGFIDKDYCISKGYVLSEGECLTVARSGSSGYVGYQASQCVVGDSAKILEPKFEASTLRLLFLRAILMVNKKKYAYIDKVTNENYAQDIVLLPAIDKDTPNWQYMEDYMRGVEQRAKNSLSALLDVKRLPKPINTAYWARFPLYSEHLFHIDMGSKMDRIKMTKFSPKINFVGRGSVNNGVVDCVDIIDDVKPYDAGCLTLSLGGSIGLTYIQEKPFYTSQNVCVLIPNSNMSLYCKRFISTMITCEGQRRYKAFIDELNRHIKTDFSILLPTKSDGEPDWQYMEMYMRGVEAIAKNKIDALQQSKKSVSPSPQTPFTNYGTVNIIDNSRNYNIK